LSALPFGRYQKVQLRYLDSPMETMHLNGVESHERFHDNFFVFKHGGSGSNFGEHGGKMIVRVKTLLGKHYCSEFDDSFRPEPYEHRAWRC
jgi:hypothetical protein